MQEERKMSRDTTIERAESAEVGAYSAGWHDEDAKYAFRAEAGLSEAVVRQMSEMKGEPEWMLGFRLRSLEHFLKRPLPHWGGDLTQLDFDRIYYYLKPDAGSARSWDDVPDAIKDTGAFVSGWRSPIKHESNVSVPDMACG